MTEQNKVTGYGGPIAFTQETLDNARAAGPRKLLTSVQPANGLPQGTPLPPFYGDAPSLKVISSEGVYYVYLSPEFLLDYLAETMQLAQWYSTLAEDDKVVMTILTPSRVFPRIGAYMTLLNLLDQSKAHLTIRVDHYEPSILSYLYLAADKLEISTSGALFFPTIHTTRPDDTARADRVMNAFVEKLAARAVGRGVFTSEEADMVRTGGSFGLRYADFAGRASEATAPYMQIME